MDQRIANQQQRRPASIGRFRQFLASKNLPHDNREKRGRETEIGDGGSGRADSGGEPNTNPPDRQSKTSVANGLPCSGMRPVQFGIAVSRQPAAVAAANPKTIS